MPVSPSNLQRAIRARAAVVAYRQAANSEGMPEGALLCDLLADLMHLAARCQNVSFDHSLQYARSNFGLDQARELCARAEILEVSA